MASKEKNSQAFNEAHLWNDLGPDAFNDDREEYYRLIIEQYVLYVGTTDSISRFRLQANAFFLTLHTALLAGIAVVLLESSSPFLLGTGLLGLLSGAALSVVWMRLLRTYRAINTAKFKVVGELEKRLPSSPLWRAEWTMLSSPSSGYVPLAQTEEWIPRITIMTYALVLIYAIAFSVSPGLRALLGA